MASKQKKSRNAENVVVAYLRYSTHNQKELSIEYQREQVEAFCKKQGYTILKFFIDEAKTATNSKRDEFQRMITEAHNKPVWSKILVFSYNRFARNTDMRGYYKVILQSLGIKILSATEDNSETPEARLCRNISASYDAYMPERCAVHTHASLVTKARKGLHCGGKPPLGYDIVNEKLVVNDFESETVRLIFKMYANNYSYTEMMKVLKEQGRTTKNGADFKKSSFNSILQQEKYKGIFVWNKASQKKFDGTYNSHEHKPLEEQVRVEGGCDAIIDEALFNRVQARMSSNSRQNKRSVGKYHYMLGGLGKVYCAECGSLMVGSAYKSHGTKYTYYVCPNHKGNACKTKNLRASYLEHLLCGIITTNILTKKNYNEYNDLINTEHGRKSHIGLNKELSGVIKAINNILKVIETNPTEEAAERLSVLSKRKEEIQKRIESLNDIPKITEENYNEIRKEFYKELKTSSDPMIYDLIDRMIKRITVSNDDVKIELNI